MIAGPPFAPGPAEASTASADRAQGDVVARAWAVLDTVLDPEVPVVSVCELGIVREVHAREQGLVVVLTPTYSGCPATEWIERSIVDALDGAGLGRATIEMKRAPAWTTDWITDAGRTKLRAYGIVPPGPAKLDAGVPMRFMPRAPAAPLACPHCESLHTERLAAFGSTACKALHRCLDCGEPFEHFKAI